MVVEEVVDGHGDGERGEEGGDGTDGIVLCFLNGDGARFLTFRERHRSVKGEVVLLQ